MIKNSIEENEIKYFKTSLMDVTDLPDLIPDIIPDEKKPQEGQSSEDEFEEVDDE